MTVSLLCLVCLAGVGFQAVDLLFGLRTPRPAVLGLKIVLGLGAGFGLSSCSLFLVGLAFDGLSPAACAVELALICCAGIALLRIARRSGVKPETLAVGATPFKTLHRVLGACCVIGLIFAVVEVWGHASWKRHGHWDAWAIWNLRARFLFRADHDWPNAFRAGFASPHTDYPLLVPLTVARYWSYLKDDSTVVPRLISLAFAFGTFALLVFSLAVLRGWGNAFLAGLVLLATPGFQVMGAWQIADGPLAFYLLAACVLLVVKDRVPEQGGRIGLLLGMFTSLAAWTKNEGWLFAVLVLVVSWVVTMKTRGTRASLREGLCIAAGMLPVVLMVLFFKVAYAPSNDLVEAVGRETIHKLADGARHAVVAKEFWFNSRLLARHFYWILPLYAVLGGVQVKTDLTAGIANAALVLLLLLAGYYLVFVSTHQDLSWHLETACFRTLYHLWPGLLFVFFTLSATPEETAAQHTGVAGRFLAFMKENVKAPSEGTPSF